MTISKQVTQAMGMAVFFAAAAALVTFSPLPGPRDRVLVTATR